MANLYAKNFSDADEVKNPPKAKVEVVKLGNVNASKLMHNGAKRPPINAERSKMEPNSCRTQQNDTKSLQNAYSLENEHIL